MQPAPLTPTAAAAEAPPAARVAERRVGPRLPRFLAQTAVRALRLARDPRSPRGAELARTYLRLKLRQRLLRRFPGLERRRERILDWTVEGSDSWMLAYLFEEVFVSGDYHFRTESPSPRIVDCGSHAGLAILYFKSLYPGARILGFEPDPETFALLERNVRGNGLADVELSNRALCPGRDVVPLYHDPAWKSVPFTSLDSRFLTTYGSRSDAPPPHRLVEATALSRHLSEPVDFLKMDIEGAEQAVLEEAAEAGKLRLVEQMVVEYHHHIEPESDRLAAFLGLLESQGFGYQIRAPLEAPFRPRAYQNFLVYAYRR